jgi:hypothetical protein
MDVGDLLLLLFEGGAAGIHQAQQQLRSRFAGPALRGEVDRTGNGRGLGDLVAWAGGQRRAAQYATLLGCCLAGQEPGEELATDDCR